MRKSFSLLELIFAIVVMGIAFTAVPTIVQNSARSAQWAQTAKGIYHGLAKVQIIRNKLWDESNADDFRTAGFYYVLQTLESASPADELVCVDGRRIGHYNSDIRRKCDSDFASVVANENNFNDIDDFVDPLADDIAIDGFNIDPDVVYISYQLSADKTNLTYDTSADLVSASTTNIKRVDVSVSSQLYGTNFKYYYYTTNIGTAKAYIRSFD